MVVLIATATTSCIDLGPSVEQLDAGEMRKVVKDWTGASLPDGMTIIEAQRYSAFMDPSMYVVFDAPDAGVGDFVAQLGERRLRTFVADCSNLSGPVAFTEVADAMQVEGAAPPSGSRINGSDGSGTYMAVQAVESGKLDRCRNVVTVYARPMSPYVNVTIQTKGGGTSRVVLSVVYT
ncbi:hypothetical protein AXK61_08610 [Tsukamurella pseudospumae]|uniref:PknH-like extracellular domain-containing protein n=1 Tax=Tsukamurella pseudospumae TaxID=239498 RepID=A0A137YU30_9ACTN|nr:hypothetical protein AXK61_08610 [Tsukamurella pseudospumae]